MNREQIVQHIFSKSSYLCVGLDTDIGIIPAHLLTAEDPVYEFNRHIIDATKEYCVAYKINTAFYESLGVNGWKSLEKTTNYIPSTHFKIADAKRGDIGNTSSYYAKAFFEVFNFDALTVNPYMGADSIQPFLQYKNKWTILLGLTSNEGSNDFQLRKTGDQLLYELVMKSGSEWGSPENLMFVVGATRSEQLINTRKLTPRHFYLVPGVGSQGGSLKEISEKVMIDDCGLLVNLSRNIIYASNGRDFDLAAAEVAKNYQKQMKIFLSSHSLKK